MSSEGELSFKVIESYELAGERRFRVKVLGTKLNIVINVAASSEEEAIEKARELAEKMQLRDFIKAVESHAE